MPMRARREAIRLFRSWALALTAILLVGICGNGVLAQRVVVWRDMEPSMHWAKAEKLSMEKEYAEALVEARRAMNLAPERYEPYMVAGHVFYAMKEWEKALEMYKRADGINPNAQVIHGRIFWCLMNLKRYNEAAQYGDRLILADDTAKDLSKYVASAWLQSGNPEKAIELLEKQLRQSPKNVEVMTRLIAAYRQIGRHDEADRLTLALAEAEAERDALLSMTN